MCGVLERIYSIFFSGNLSTTQFVSVTVQFYSFSTLTVL